MQLQSEGPLVSPKLPQKEGQGLPTSRANKQTCGGGPATPKARQGLNREEFHLSAVIFSPPSSSPVVSDKLLFRRNKKVRTHFPLQNVDRLKLRSQERQCWP